jgi:transposase
VGRVSIVMGLDQHRAQITAEWIDTETGEVSRSRVAPADRASVRRFLGRFSGRELEVALEATTGWRFVVEELRRMGARVHLAEPAQTSGLRGPKRRAKTDGADSRHLRELLMIERLPESWIPPDHILDLRATVRLRHTLSHQRCEWQRRIQSVLYHHGVLTPRGRVAAGDRTGGQRGGQCRHRGLLRTGGELDRQPAGRHPPRPVEIKLAGVRGLAGGRPLTV